MLYTTIIIRIMSKDKHWCSNDTTHTSYVHNYMDCTFSDSVSFQLLAGVNDEGLSFGLVQHTPRSRHFQRL